MQLGGKVVRLDGSDQGAKMEDCGRCQVEWDGSERGWIVEGEVNPKGALD